MPTYEYACESCGNRYEKRESFSAKARQKCPRCGKAAQRVLFAPPVVFKGSGFYKNDARGSDSGTAASAATPAVPDLGGHGHSHGPGTHTHDTPSSPAAADATDTKASGAEAPAAS